MMNKVNRLILSAVLMPALLVGTAMSAYALSDAKSSAWSHMAIVEFSVIVNRLYDYQINDYRKNDYQKSNADEFVLSPVLNENETQIVQNPNTVEDYEKIFLYMAKNNQYQIDISYTADYKDDIKNGRLKNLASEAFENTFIKYPEHCCYTDNLTIGGGYGSVFNKITLEIDSSVFSNSEITKMRAAFLKESEAIVRELIESKKITTEMSDKEKARVLYEWVAVNLKYDRSEDHASYTGYGASHYRTAVCQGYTALYNTMCKMVGIQVQGISGTARGSGAASEGHIWTLATLDGKQVHIDVTFGDPVPDVSGRCSFDYFAVDSEFMKKNHTWDKEKYGI